jgi:hypothetical protein
MTCPSLVPHSLQQSAATSGNPQVTLGQPALVEAGQEAEPEARILIVEGVWILDFGFSTFIPLCLHALFVGFCFFIYVIIIPIPASMVLTFVSCTGFNS